MKQQERKARKNRRLPRAEPEAAPVPAPGRVAERWVAVADRLSILRRPLLFVFRLALVGVAAVGAVAVGQLVEQHVRRSPAFATVEVAVDGLERLQREDVLQAAGLALGQNVFEVSPETAQAALEQHPWIAHAEVTRRLPGTYVVTLDERRAVAIAALEDLHLVGEDATVFKAHAQGDPVDLPVITGLLDEAFEEDPPLRASALVSAVALLHDYRDVGLWRREPIGEIHVTPDGSLSLYAGEDATLVRLGQRPFREKLRRFRKVLDRLQARDARPAYVYLDNPRRPDRVTVRLK